MTFFYFWKPAYQGADATRDVDAVRRKRLKKIEQQRLKINREDEELILWLIKNFF